MKASEKLAQIKSSAMTSERINEITKNINALSREVKTLKDSILDLKTFVTGHNTVIQQQITELYAFSRKLERVYYSGLMNESGGAAGGGTGGGGTVGGGGGAGYVQNVHLDFQPSNSPFSLNDK